MIDDHHGPSAGEQPCWSEPWTEFSARQRVASGVALQRGKGPAMQVFVETQRLVLRRFTMADVDNLAGLDADPDVYELHHRRDANAARRDQK
jgi:hypothetical protein